MTIRPALIMALAALSGCAAQPWTARAPPAHSQPASDEIFDEQTGASALIAAEPLVFARARSDVAAHAHDFATLVAVEVNNSARDREYLLLYRWSTVDTRMSPPPAPDAGTLRIIADGRVIELAPVPELPLRFGRRQALHLPKHGMVVAHAYDVDAAMLEFIAASGDLVVRMPQEPLDTPFTLWEDGRQALHQFLRRSGTP